MRSATPEREDDIRDRPRRRVLEPKPPNGELPPDDGSDSAKVSPILGLVDPGSMPQELAVIVIDS